MASTATPRTSSELIDRIQAGWRPLRNAIGATPAARFEQRTAAGWTLKGMVAHLAYWESTVPPFIQALRDGLPGERGGDVDGKNATAAAAAAELEPQEILRQWDEAHALVLDLARTLTAAEARDERIIEKFAGETYGHYPEHYRELTLDETREGTS